jgi:hypothetical protein
MLFPESRVLTIPPNKDVRRILSVHNSGSKSRTEESESEREREG